MDIIALIFVWFRMKGTLTAKGYETRKWMIKLIVVWCITDITGAAASFLIQGDLRIASVSGLLLALASYFYLQNKVNKLPDLNQKNDWMSKLGI